MKPCLLYLWLLLAATPVWAAPQAPAWVKSLEGTPTPKLPGEVPVYALLDEATITIREDGTATEQVRYALRVLNQSGYKQAVADLIYTEKVDEIVSGSSWLVRGGQVVKTESIGKWLDLCQVKDGTVFTEQRVRVSMFARETLPGDLFAFETVKTVPLLFAQHAVPLPEGRPTGRNRIHYILPKGWKLDALVSGSTLPEPAFDAIRNSWTWTRTDCPYIPDEPWLPRSLSGTPWLLVRFTPPAGAKPVKFVPTASWADVGSWIDRLSEGQCDSSAALGDIVRRIQAEKGPDRFAVIRALGEHVQRLRYISVEKGLGLGYGYRPRKASEVLARGYGDCKDKVNLLRAMLREAGIVSHLVAVQYGWSTPTESAWPSPAQFNHAIIAIEVNDSIDLPGVMTASDGRRLLFFDPTDEYTLLGDLPWLVQGATGLIVQGANSGLISVPAVRPEEAWVFGTRARVAISGSGKALGTVELSGHSQAGRLRRAYYRSASANELTERATRYMSSMLRGVVVREPAFVEDPLSGDATLKFTIEVPAVFQAGPNGRVILRLDMCNRDSVPQLGTKPRVRPVEIVPVDHSEEVVFELPAGFVVEDAPKPAVVETLYGRYSRVVEIGDGIVTLRRRLQLHQQIVAPADYEKVRDFLTEAAKADKAALLMRRGS